MPARTSELSVCFGCVWVRNTALERKWSPPISGWVIASAPRTSVSLTIVRYLRNGSSGLSALGARSNARPVSAGDQRCCDAPQSLLPAAPCTISMQTSRVRSSDAALAVFDHRPRAGTIASRNGSATVAPSPRSIVRRGMCFPAMNDILLSPVGRVLGTRLVR